MSDDIDKDKLAKAVAEGIYPRDTASHTLGVEIVESTDGCATARMTVREDMLNFHGTCHGGFLYSLAGSVFAYVINSDNRAAVVQSGSISYTKPAHLGDVLTARAKVVSLSGRSGIYDVEIANQDNEIVALFRGQSCKVKGESVPGLNARFGLADKAL
ncbi:hydroxyphenylacetyl-CoA thioesterase PaaI [Magnetovibrio sp.]|uniref:hydroxyphenylacetyl-CoA thioesterase PaaI n=1 Tax=Magnetovibrio sp. TaxID=2024836 RepID=UPI002F95E9BB